MKVLIVGDDHGRQTRLAAAMMQTGFQVICVETARSAGNYLGTDLVDVLILTETRSARIGNVWSCISHSRNPGLSVIVMSDRTGPASDELFEDIPSLYCVLALDIAPGTIASIALASILPHDAAVTVSQPEVAVTVSQPVVAVTVSQPVVAVTAAATTGSAGPSRTLLQPLARPAGRLAAPVIVAAAPVPMIPQPMAAAAYSYVNVPDFGSELAALERELDRVNHDRPSVLGPSIAEELPRWSQPAPKLAMLTDLDTPNPAAALQVATQMERRFRLGVTLQ